MQHHPHVHQARRFVALTLIAGVVIGLVGLIFPINDVSPFTFEQASYGYGELSLPPILGYVSAAWILSAAGLLGAGILSILRYRRLAREPVTVKPRKSPIVWRGRQVVPEVFIELGRSALSHAGDWIDGLVTLFLTVAAGYSLYVAYNSPGDIAIAGVGQQLIGGAMILSCLPLLVLERIYANTSAQALPEAPQLARLLRVALLTTLAFGSISFLYAQGFAWLRYAEYAIAAVLAIVTAEVFLRTATLFFVPFTPLESRTAAARSSFAGLLRWGIPTFGKVTASVRDNFGIDLSRSWAITFVVRALPALIGGFIVFSWLLTGVTTLPINQRGVNERFGRPVAVLGPGLHFHLPWPLSVIRKVELGAVHEMTVGGGDIPDTSVGGYSSGEPASDPVLDPAEAQPPYSADRLWDTTHPSEVSYMIASETRGEQSFQIADVDLKVVYRIGLSDQAALNSLYQLEQPERMIKAAAGQLILKHFSHYTLLDILGQSRERFAVEFQNAIQSSLDDVQAGIEVIAVIIEAIHPPPAAASAYHSVQAAEIQAQARIAEERGSAIGLVKQAEQTAARTQAEAAGSAAELVNQATYERTLFDGERAAYRTNARVFIFERWLEKLGFNLQNADLTLVDHRLGGAGSPTIDLRNLSGNTSPGGSDARFGRN